MKKFSLLIIILLGLTFNPATTHGQLRIKIVAGLIYMNDGSVTHPEKKYAGLTDSLDKNLKINPKDTTSLFDRALLYLTFNNVMSKPYQRTNGALENLTIAKYMVEKADSLNMKNFNLKILRAEIYRELTYRFSGDESWMFNNTQIADRKVLFNNYKALANKYYDELAQLDSHYAYDYQKLKINNAYPL